MKVSNMDRFTKGWFIGDFEPCLLRTTEFESAIKRYRAGDEEESHFHKIATEFTGVIVGEIEMNGHRFGPGQIVMIEPNEMVKFRAISDSVTFVIKVPSAKNDKYNAR